MNPTSINGAYRAAPVLVRGPQDLETAIKWLEEHGDTLSQAQLKAFPNRFIRKANVLQKRAVAGHFADQASARFAQRAGQRLAILAEMVKQAAAIDADSDPEGYAEAAKAVRDMTKAFKRAERADGRQPLFALRSEKHNTDKGSRAIRRKVSHDWRKGRKPDPEKGFGSVPLDHGDLLELHGRFAANVLTVDEYNAALAAGQALGRLKHLVPLVAKGEAELSAEKIAEMVERKVEALGKEAA